MLYRLGISSDHIFNNHKYEDHGILNISGNFRYGGIVHPLLKQNSIKMTPPPTHTHLIEIPTRRPTHTEDVHTDPSIIISQHTNKFTSHSVCFVNSTVLSNHGPKNAVPIPPDLALSISGINVPRRMHILFCLVWFLNVLVNNQAISRTGPKTERLTILRAGIDETEMGDHDFRLSRSHYTDTDPTSTERAATAGIEPGISSPGIARSTD